MSYLSDAHADWHYVNGAYNSECPLDCGAMSPEQREAEEACQAEEYAAWRLTPDGIEAEADHQRWLTDQNAPEIPSWDDFPF